MTTSVIIDLVIAGTLLLCLYLGWKRGLFRSLAELAAIVLSLVLAAQIAGFAADAILDKTIRPATVTAVAERVDELLAFEEEQFVAPQEGLKWAIDAIPNEFVRQQAEKFLVKLDLPLELVGRDALLAAALGVVDTVLDTVVRSLLHALLYALSFLLLNLIFRLLIRAMDLPFRLPLLRQLNQLGGLLFGGLKGLALVYLGVWILGQTGLFLTEEVIDQSVLLRIAAAWTGVSAPL